MVYVTRSEKRNCNVDWCMVHKGRRKLGWHAAGQLVPETGPAQALVLRILHEDGRRTANMAVYDRNTKTWTYEVPLPARPRKAYAAAVSRARRFVRSGVLV